MRAAVDLVFDRFEPEAIIAAGSIVRGAADRASDFDIHVIHGAPFKQRLQRWFGDVPVEVFVNPPASVRRYFVEEHREGRPLTAHMFASGFVVLEADVVHALTSEAAAWLAKPSPFTAEDDTSARYFAAGLLEDAEDIVDRDPECATALLGEAVMAMLHYFLRARSGTVPRHKELLARVEQSDPELGREARRFFAAATLEMRLEAARAIADASVGARGFFEWESERVPVALETE